MAFQPIATTRTVMGMPTARLAIWWLVVSEIVIFGGILATYLMHRLGHPEWANYAVHTNVYAGGFNTFVLLTSSVFAVLAHDAASQGDGKKAAKLLSGTLVCAVMFLCIKGYEWSVEISHGYTITANGFWSFYYTAAGVHGLHVIIGGIIMAWIAKDAYQNKYLHRVELVGIYWHFVDLVWIFLFPLLYIAK
ncbi:MAG: cytochrome oxidase subunit III [Rhodobacterales bacterium]|nr:cytochrome oxidase subunit III [Rhodobacterales bacterium]